MRQITPSFGYSWLVKSSPALGVGEHRLVVNFTTLKELVSSHPDGTDFLGEGDMVTNNVFMMSMDGLSLAKHRLRDQEMTHSFLFYWMKSSNF